MQKQSRKHTVKHVLWEDHLAEEMRNPEFRKFWQDSEEEWQLIHALIGARIQRQLTQQQLAEKIGAHQSAIARLESGKGNPSYKFLQRVAKGLDKKLHISFV